MMHPRRGSCGRGGRTSRRPRAAGVLRCALAREAQMRAVARRKLLVAIGSAAGWPLAARAQPPLPVIGFLHQGSQEPLYNMTAFKEGLREIGIIEGQNVFATATIPSYVTYA